MKTPVPTQQHFDINVEFLNIDDRSRKQPELPSSFKFTDAFDLRFIEAAIT